MMYKIALIPAYEPNENLIRLVDKLIDNNFKVVVVDDGSGEEYQEYFSKLRCKVISYKNNRGKGYALKKGLKYIKDNFNRFVVVTMDSDGQHTIKDAINLCNYALSYPRTLVLGSRRRNKNFPIKSYIGNVLTRFTFLLATGQDIYDTQTGLRAFSDKIVNYLLKTSGTGFEYEINVLLNARKNHINIKEITIKTIYIDNNSNTHFKPFKDSFRIYKEIIKFSLSSFTCFLIDYMIYAFTFLLSSKIILANIVARAISSFINYNINKNLVFKTKKKSILEYYKLVVFILILNTIILWILSHFITTYIAKIITELTLFILNFTIQKKFIFNEETSEK